MEMEQEIESVFENITERPTVDHNTPTIVHFIQYLQILVSLVGLLLNTLLVFVVLRSKQMTTRTNLIFVNRCIYDTLSLTITSFFVLTYMFFGEAMYEHIIMTCLEMHTMGLFEMAMWGFTLMLLCNRLINSEKLSTRTLLTLGNLTVLVYFVAQVVQCLLGCSSRRVVKGVVALSLGVLLILATITKDVNRCRRKAGIPISKDSSFRLNIARILTYNWTVCFFLSKISASYLVWWFFELYMSLNAVFTFAYVFCADEAYKTRILKVLNYDFEPEVEDIVLENCVYAKTTRKNRNVVVDFEPLDDYVVNHP